MGPKPEVELILGRDNQGAAAGQAGKRHKTSAAELGCTAYTWTTNNEFIFPLTTELINDFEMTVILRSENKELGRTIISRKLDGEPSTLYDQSLTTSFQESSEPRQLTLNLRFERRGLRAALLGPHLR